MMIFIICVPFKRKTVNKLSRFFSSSLHSFSVSLLVVCVAQSKYNVISCLTLPMHFSALKFPARLRWRSRKLHHFRPRCELRTSRIVQSTVALILYVHELSCKLLYRSSFLHSLRDMDYINSIIVVPFFVSYLFGWSTTKTYNSIVSLYSIYRIQKVFFCIDEFAADLNLFLTWCYFSHSISPLYVIDGVFICVKLSRN